MEKILSILSLIFAFLSLLCCCIPYLGLIFAIIGLILAIVGLVYIKKDPLLNMEKTYKNLAIAGIIISIFGIIFGICINTLVFFSAFEPDLLTNSLDLNQI